MSFMDGLGDKAKDLAADHPDQVNQGIERGGDMIDDKTGGKFAGQVDKGQEFATERFGGGDQNAATDSENTAADNSGQPQE